jgi:thioredoxin-like negative regulator of GroEL
LYHLAQSLNAQGRRQEAQAIEKQLDQIKKDLQIVAKCREQLAQDPTNSQLRHEIGAAYLRIGRPGEALVWLNSVLDREPNHLPTLRTLVELHERSGNQLAAAELRGRMAAGR